MTGLDDLKHVEVPIKGGGFVFVLDKGEVINSEAEAMLQALHSRSVGGLKGHLEILKEKGADKFMSTFYVGYGHKSIGDCGSTTLFIEGVSMLVAKAIQDSKLYSGQEASTRYIDFSKQAIINPLNTKEGEDLQEEQRAFYLSVMEPLNEYLKSIYPIQEGEKETIYDKAIAARAFDITRGFLPSGTSTNLAWHTNLRQIADRLLFLRHHLLEEVRNVADAIEKAVLEKYPNSFSTKRYEGTENYNKELAKDYYYHNPNQEEFKVERDDIHNEELQKYKHLFDLRPEKTELPVTLNLLGEIEFSFQLDFGSFRDLQRHRAINQRMPLVTMDLGFNDWYMQSLPEDLREKAKTHLQNIKEKIEKLNCPKEVAQYYIPMGYNLSNRFSGTLPAIIYMVELRATRFVHPTLREKAKTIAKYIQDKHNITIHLDKESDRFDVKRGEHDIVMK